MTTYRQVQIKCQNLAEIGIDEACQVFLQEGGTAEVLKFLAYLAHGDVLPRAVILRLKKQAMEVVGQDVGKTA